MKSFIFALFALASTSSFAVILDCKGVTVTLAPETTLKMKVVVENGDTKYIHEGYAMRLGVQTANSRTDKFVLPTGESVTKTWKSSAEEDYAYSFNGTSSSSNKEIDCQMKQP